MAGALLCLVMLWLGAGWQRRDPRADGPGRRPRATPSIGIVVLAVLVFALFVAHRPRRSAGSAAGSSGCSAGILPRRVARPLGVVVATALVIFLLNGVLFQGLVEAMNSAFSVKDDGTEEGAVEPTAPERSGSPESLVPWEDLGLQGRNFVGKGPTPEELEDVLRPAGPGAGPRVRRAGQRRGRRRPGRPRRPRPRAGRRLRPGGARGRHDDGDRLGRPGGERLAGVRVQRRHRDGGDAVLLPAQLDVLPRRPGQGAGRRPRAVRRRLRRLGAAAARRRARSCTCSGRASAPSAGRPPSAGSPTSRTARTACCGPGRPTSTSCGAGIVADREDGSPEWLPVVRRRPHRPVRRRGPRPRPAAGPVGRAAGRLPAERVGPHRLVVAAADPEPPRLAARRARARRLPGAWCGCRSSRSGRSPPTWRSRPGCPDGHGHKYQADYVDGWAEVAQPPGWTDADTERLRPLVGGD